MEPELFAKQVEEGAAVVRRLDGTAVDGQVEDPGRARAGGSARRPVGCSGGAQLKEEPQPQVRVAFGFETWNPAPCSPSE